MQILLTRKCDGKEETLPRRYIAFAEEIEVHPAGGTDVTSVCRGVSVSDKTYYGWRKRYGGTGRAKLTEFKALEKEKQRLRKILDDLELDKLILMESLDHLKTSSLGVALNPYTFIHVSES